MHQTWHLRHEPEGLYIEHHDPLASPPIALIPVTVDALHVLAAQMGQQQMKEAA